MFQMKARMELALDICRRSSEYAGKNMIFTQRKIKCAGKKLTFAGETKKVPEKSFLLPAKICRRKNSGFSRRKKLCRREKYNFPRRLLIAPGKIAGKNAICCSVKSLFPSSGDSLSNEFVSI